MWDGGQSACALSSGPSPRPSTWSHFGLNLHDFVLLLENVPSALTRVRNCQSRSRLLVFRRICTVLSPFLNVGWLAVQEWNWILDFWGGGDLKRKCSAAGSRSPWLAASLHAVQGELWAELHFSASCFSSLPWRQFQTCSSFVCYTAPLVVTWQDEEKQLTMLFILLLGGGQEADEIVCFPNSVFFCYHSCSLGIKCHRNPD